MIVFILITLVVGMVIGILIMALVVSTNRDMNYFMGQRAVGIAYDARKAEPTEGLSGDFNFGWNSACEYIASKLNVESG